jgi:hypothetical protein
MLARFFGWAVLLDAPARLNQTVPIGRTVLQREWLPGAQSAVADHLGLVPQTIGDRSPIGVRTPRLGFP